MQGLSARNPGEGEANLPHSEPRAEPRAAATIITYRFMGTKTVCVSKESRRLIIDNH